MSVVEYNRERIIEFCSRKFMALIISDIKIKWPGAILYVPPANVVELRVFHDDANLSDIVDIVLRNNPNWNRERFLHGRYGFFINCTMEHPREEDVLV